MAQWMLGQAAPLHPFRDDPGASIVAQQRERICHDNLQTLLRSTTGQPSTADAGSGNLPQIYDCFGDRFEPDSWGIAMTLNFVAMQQIPASRRAAVVVSMRDEGIILLEWIAHYRVLGFEKIFVFTNDNDDLSDRLLDRLVQLGIITCYEQQTALTVAPHIRAFEYALHCLPALRDFEFVFYPDTDELLILEQCYDHNVHRFLDAFTKSQHEDAAAILFQWRWCISADRFAWAPELMLTRFQHGTPVAQSKAMVRLADVTSMRQVHFPETKRPSIMVNPVFEPTTPYDQPLAGLQTDATILNHYWCKSFQEFVIKRRRGMMITGAVQSFNRDEKLFFEWNRDETEANHVAPPPELLRRVEKELESLRALPGVAACEQACRERFFDIIGNDGDLSAYYENVKRAAKTSAAS